MGMMAGPPDEAGHVPAMVALLARMLAVDPARRASVVDVLRDPWLVRTLLGDWSDVLLHTGGGGRVHGVNGAAGGVSGDVGISISISSARTRERGEARETALGSIRTARTFTTSI